MTSKFFSGLPKLTPLSDGKHWVLDDNFDYWFTAWDTKRRERVEVPKGFVTDFASIPQVFWNIFPPWGKYGFGSIIHDFLYSTKPFSRARADRIFLQAMIDMKVSWYVRWPIYSQVRLWGWVAWNGKKST